LATQLYVAQTKPRAEPLAREQLGRQGFEAIFPTEVRRRVVRRCLVSLIQPLFPSYIFVAFDRSRDRWQAVNSTRGVRRLMCTPAEEPIAVPDDVAARIREGCREPLREPEAVVALFARGDRVRVRSGPFAGHVAPVTREDDGLGRVAVLLAFLGRQQEVYVGAAQLELA
jgi:transcriptional antiterminator RfaH